MNLYIKNMVCSRCIMSVEQILRENGLRYASIRLGEVVLLEEPGKEQLEKLNTGLKKVGFELLDDQRKQQIEKIKTLLIQKVQEGNIEEHFSLSKFLTNNLYKDYSSISKLFSEVEGITIEQFFILQKIEKAKEWMVYNQYSLSQIAFNLGYSSVQHLSNQFKKVTGMTPSQFRKIGAALRKPLDQVKQ
ncbi:MAG: AraC family transcriptional regulator [Bacteroidota bacterium]|nr:helix-turn-helix transcriptional regulator [Flavisolibacter sp.]MDQ3844158.1 AraC family transcriptional regulator [Bacteroidota bacterium]MBD0285494.1 helix-turn-helix transcriptional regulator [Flavisolibacter sp.]MBD0295187.1 helix-turn-helix transcriptional regulator [Flavisolibacter sp.]MBD0350813.1 helix-turn-helix transcriptional regulator [Flavisolibacter sp.]